MVRNKYELLLIVNFIAIISCEQEVKIYGGTNAKYLSWPWMALIQLRNEFKCGATIINENWILTAAHCLERETSPDLYRVILGEHNIEAKEGSEVYMNVSKMILHPRYLKKVKGEWDNDIALIKLSKRLDLSGEHKHLKAVDLAFPDTDIVNQTCIATGWGKTKFEKASNILQQVELITYNRSFCIESYNTSVISEGMICAGSPSGLYDTCAGDSGGPLQCKISTDLYSNGFVQIGITSWGEGCGTPGYPGVYTKVATYSNWIRKNTYSSSTNRKPLVNRCDYN